MSDASEAEVLEACVLALADLAAILSLSADEATSEAAERGMAAAKQGRAVLSAVRAGVATPREGRPAPVPEGYEQTESERWESLLQAMSDHHRGEHDWSSPDPYDCSVCHATLAMYRDEVRRNAWDAAVATPRPS